jgi:multiple sugar transport system substrate-binding protein
VASGFYDPVLPGAFRTSASSSRTIPRPTARQVQVLDDVLNWATNVKLSGYATAAIDEIYSTWVLNTMFGKVAAGQATPEAALDEAEAACKRIFGKWKEKGLV